MACYSPSSSPVERRRDPKCSLCVNHLGASAPRTLGHKNKCPYADCDCEKCEVTISRRQGTAVEQHQRRNPGKSVKRLNRPTKCTEKVESVLKAVKGNLESIINKCYKINCDNEELVISELRGLLRTVEQGLDEDMKQMPFYQGAFHLTQNFDRNLFLNILLFKIITFDFSTDNQNCIALPTAVPSHMSPNGSVSSGCSYSNSPPSFENKYYDTLPSSDPLNNFTYYHETEYQR